MRKVGFTPAFFVCPIQLEEASQVPSGHTRQEGTLAASLSMNNL